MKKKIKIMAVIMAVFVINGCSKSARTELQWSSDLNGVIDKSKAEETDIKDNNGNRNINEKGFGELIEVFNVNENSSTATDQKKLTGESEEKSQKDENLVNITKKVVVIDPGHGDRSNLEKELVSPESNLMKIKDGGGASGVITKIPEYKVNMEVAVKLKKVLEEKGINVIMTKTEHSQNLGNIERAEVGNNANANLVIRIHCDSSESSSARGASMLIPDAVNENTKLIAEESKKYGKIILDELTKQIGMYNRGLILSKDMTGFNWSKVPVILVEMGFMSNPQEDKLLSDAVYQDKLAKALADGIESALN
jgi:N-acetylmuramoyl-L-alanine amidase